jgi:hypothetical protein
MKPLICTSCNQPTTTEPMNYSLLWVCKCSTCNIVAIGETEAEAQTSFVTAIYNFEIVRANGGEA